MKMYEMILIPVIHNRLSHLSITQEAEKSKFRLAAGLLWILEWKGDLFNVFHRPDAQIMPMNHYNDHVWTNSISSILPCEVVPLFSLLAKDCSVIHTSWTLHRKVQEEKDQKNISSPDVFVNNIFFFFVELLHTEPESYWFHSGSDVWVGLDFPFIAGCDANYLFSCLRLHFSCPDWANIRFYDKLSRISYGTLRGTVFVFLCKCFKLREIVGFFVF